MLLLPLFWLSQPATNAVKGAQGSPGGKLAQLRDRVPPQPGAARPDRSHQRDDQAGHARACAAWRPTSSGRRPPTIKMKKDWTNLRRHAQPDHQGPAELHQRLDQPGLEPLLQRLGRVRRLPRALPLGHQGHRLPQRGHQVQRAPAAAAVGHGLDDLARRSARPTRASSTAGSWPKTPTTATRCRWTCATSVWITAAIPTTGSSARAGMQSRSRWKTN